MEESFDGRKEQNEAARVEVRRGYKHLMEDISRNEETLICPEDDNNELLGYLRQGDQLFSQVRGPQECVMDAAVVRNLSRICRSQVHQMSTNINQFACEEYAEKLRRSININNTGLDRRRWIQLGKCVNLYHFELCSLLISLFFERDILNIRLQFYFKKNFIYARIFSFALFMLTLSLFQL